MKKKKNNKSIQYVSFILITLGAVILTALISWKYINYNRISNKIKISVISAKDFTFSSSILYNEKGNIFIKDNGFIKLNNKLKDEKIKFVELLLIESNQKQKVLKYFNDVKKNRDKSSNEISSLGYMGTIASWGFSVNNDFESIEDIKNRDYLFFDSWLYEDYEYSYSSLNKDGMFKPNNINNVFKNGSEYELEMFLIVYYDDNTIGEPQTYPVSLSYSKLNYESPIDHLN